MHAILLPDPALFELTSHLLAGKLLTLEIRTTGQWAKCPDCHQASARIHSSYERTVRDLPMAGFAVVLHVRVRRFFCDRAGGPRRTFAERMPGSIESYARRTNRMADSQREIGFSSGGEAGSRITRRLALPASPDTLIRLVRLASIPEAPTPGVLGIDDWAFRKGHSYGTILVDLETHRPVDLLADRSMETVRRWLVDHPGVQIIARDRAPAYIEAIHAGAPRALQVADRWHLLHNLVETIERLLNRRYALLQEAFRAACPAPVAPESPAEAPLQLEMGQEALPARPPGRAEQQRQEIRDKHRAQFEEIKRLRNEEGLGIRAICRRLHVGREKVRKSLANDQPPEYKRRKQKTLLTPYWPHLRERWASGQRNGMILWGEIRAMGFTGTYQTMARELALLRKQMPKEKKRPAGRKPALPRPAAPDPVRPFSARQTAWLFVKDQNQLEGEKALYLNQLLLLSEDFQRLHLLVHQFWEMLAERKPDELRGWMTQAKASGMVELKYFVQGLEKDFPAVQAALIYEWSNGPTEGHNTRLKMIKRQMYGRGNFDLLRQRVLYPG